MSETIRNTFGIGTNVQGKGFIAGVELEVESVKDWKDLPHGWIVETDGSLRNEGREFISPPLSRSSLETHFKMLHTNNLKYFPEWEPFTERTSIHVHVNVLDQTPEQVKSIVLWYALFEPVFFAMVAPVRRNNIHCVGLDQTFLNETYKRSLPLFVQKWHKYTALNLLPVKSQGTIEFRHMDGHNDSTRFNEWVRTLENLWVHGQTYILDKHSLTQESILEAFDVIFKDSAIKSIRGNVLELISDNAIDIKLALI